MNNPVDVPAALSPYRVFHKELYNFERVYKLIQRTCSVLKCHNIAKHTEFYLG
jgi:hypothetical protein